MLVIHAEDDPKIPVSLARTLVDGVREQGREDISMEVAPASLGYGHNQVIHQDHTLTKTLPNLIFSNRYLGWQV